MNARPGLLSPVCLGATWGRSRCVSPSAGKEVVGRRLPHIVLAALGPQDAEAGLGLFSDVHLKQMIALPHCLPPTPQRPSHLALSGSSPSQDLFPGSYGGGLLSIASALQTNRRIGSQKAT